MELKTIARLVTGLGYVAAAFGVAALVSAFFAGADETHLIVVAALLIGGGLGSVLLAGAVLVLLDILGQVTVTRSQMTLSPNSKKKCLYCGEAAIIEG